MGDGVPPAINPDTRSPVELRIAVVGAAADSSLSDELYVVL